MSERTRDDVIRAEKLKRVTKRQLFDECIRLRAENGRLNQLVASKRPEIAQLREIELTLREYFDCGASRLLKAHAIARALLPGDLDLPTLDEIYGCMSRAADLVDSEMTPERAPCQSAPETT